MPKRRMRTGASGKAFREATAGELVDLGLLHVPTGRLYCCDPFLAHEVGPLDRQVEPGSYRVKLVLRTVPEWGQRVAAAILEINRVRPSRWEVAGYRSDDGTRGTQFEVDAGLACFMDASTCDAFITVLDRFYASVGAAENYYDSVLAAEFTRSADPERPGHAGDWAMHHPVPDDPRNIAMFASGLGDGLYAAEWGLDLQGQPALLGVDFGVTV